MGRISNSTRALFFLYDIRKKVVAGAPHPRSTQQGIAAAIKVPRTHMTRILRPLLKDGLVYEEKSRLPGSERRIKTYSITPKGVARAEELIERLRSEEIVLGGHEENQKIAVGQVLKKQPRPGFLAIADAIDSGIMVSPVRRPVVSNTPIMLEEFYDREEELERAAEFLESRSNVLVLISNRGYGSSTLMKKAALELTDLPLLWYDLSIDDAWESINRAVSDITSILGIHNEKQLLEERIMLCFDNYIDPHEKTVDGLIELIHKIRGKDAKLMVAMSAETPSYKRFYQRDDINSGIVTEIRVGRLPEEYVRLMIGEDLDDEAMKMIYMLTRGQPLALRMLRQRDEEGLKRIFPREEVRFLMYLLSRKK